MYEDDRDPNERLANGIAHRVRRLAGRLEALDLLAPVDDAEGEWEIGFITNQNTLEVVPAVVVGERTYWEQGTELIVQRPASGRIQWTRLGDDGEPIEPWHYAPPRPEDAVQN